MHFEYIDENLDEVIQNIDNVLYFRPYEVDGKQALFAMMKIDNGVYTKLQITKTMSKVHFPFEPIYWFSKGPGYKLMRDNEFLIFDNWTALNISNLEGFKQQKLDKHRIFNVGLFATFSDGSATFIRRETPKKFAKEGGLDFYIDTLKQYKEFNPQYEEYQIIECFDAGYSTIAIPKLQEKKEQQKVKKLPNNN